MSPASVPTAFICYSHADEKYLERLRKHMALLQREEAIVAWTDHQIAAGARLDGTIRDALDDAQLFIALVSPDYLASNYCYEKEFEFALKKADAGALTILPVIVEPCDWLSSPFRQFRALPKDGKPVSEWTNSNLAFLDVVSGIRSLVTDAASYSEARPSEAALQTHPGRRMKIKQEFDSIQKSEFADQAFAAIADYFRNSCTEVNGIDDLRAKYHSMNDNAFTCTVVNRGIKGGREAHITVHNSKGRRHFHGDISYVFEAHAEPVTSNGSIRIAADDYNMFLTLGYGGMMGREDTKYDAQQAAEALWVEFIGHAGIEIE